jgi:hypothetical protein
MHVSEIAARSGSCPTPRLMRHQSCAHNICFRVTSWYAAARTFEALTASTSRWWNILDMRCFTSSCTEAGSRGSTCSTQPLYYQQQFCCPCNAPSTLNAWLAKIAFVLQPTGHCYPFPVSLQVYTFAPCLQCLVFARKQIPSARARVCLSTLFNRCAHLCYFMAREHARCATSHRLRSCLQEIDAAQACIC